MPWNPTNQPATTSETFARVYNWQRREQSLQLLLWVWEKVTRGDFGNALVSSSGQCTTYNWGLVKSNPDKCNSFIEPKIPLHVSLFLIPCGRRDWNTNNKVRGIFQWPDDFRCNEFIIIFSSRLCLQQLISRHNNITVEKKIVEEAFCLLELSKTNLVNVVQRHFRKHFEEITID